MVGADVLPTGCRDRGGRPTSYGSGPSGRLPLRQTVYGRFATFRDSDVRKAINHRPVTPDRERVGHEASASAVVIDSQSVTTTPDAVLPELDRIPGLFTAAGQL